MNKGFIAGVTKPIDTSSWPWYININPFMGSKATLGVWSNAAHVNTIASIVGGLIFNSGNVVNDYIEWFVPVAPGTWALEVMRITREDAGKEEWTFINPEGTIAIGTIDDYNASIVYNVKSTVGTFVNNSTEVGVLRCKVAAKNASSSGHYLRLEMIQLRRTN